MATKKAGKPPIDPDRLEEIRRDASSGRNWAAETGYGPACQCGMKPEAGHRTVAGIPVWRGCLRHA
jgi:hypothetical protein